MQGKITKVLNMKPVEILSMIEEAAGTKTYDTKKANSLQTIDKKNAKLNEIERVLREDITPMIEKLKQERSAYIEYQKCEREHLHLHKISVAHQFVQHEESVRKAHAEFEQIEENIKRNETRIKEIDNLMDDIRLELMNMRKHMESGDESLAEFEARLKENQIEVTKLKSEAANLKSNINSDTKKKTQIEKSISENNNMIKNKERKLEEMRQSAEGAQEQFAKAERELKSAQELYEALCCGFVAGENGELATIQEQLMNARNRLSQQQTNIKQAQIK
jgi:structural maintenance of chromosome 2